MSWYVASTVHSSSDEYYIFLNNSTILGGTDTYTIADPAFLQKYLYLDYILVGGGGSGGFSYYNAAIGPNYGGGGGGSGNLVSTFPLSNITNSVFQYYVPQTIPNSSIVLNSATSVVVQIGSGGVINGGGYGNDGAPTSITVNYSTGSPLIKQAGGGLKGGDASSNCGGTGGGGYNGGGGGGGGNCGGTGGVSNGGENGENGDESNAGNGGGWGKGKGAKNFTESGENAGGGGGGGSGILNPDTGGRGAASYRTATNIQSTAGYDYTGGGGGGRSTNVGDGGMDASPGGKGYAILWFHN